MSAQDGGGLFALVNAKVNISIVAGLVAPPVFEQTQYHFTVSEDALRGTMVGTVQASSKTGGYNDKNLFFLGCNAFSTSILMRNRALFSKHKKVREQKVEIGS